MVSRIPVCARIGLVAGLFTGLITSGIGGKPPFNEASMGAESLGYDPAASLVGGLIVALIAGAIIAQIHIQFFRYPSFPLMLVMLIVAIPVGLIVGLISQMIGVLWIGILEGSVIGFFLGWLICKLLCWRKEMYMNMEATHVKR